jgi:predicted DNA-binding protein (MmcQ/YjbR family)
MTNDSIREFCMALQGTTEQVQWEDHILFKVGGKMFAMTKLGGHMCNFKTTPEKFLELVEMAGITPTAYNMWKYHWVTCEPLTALPDREFRECLKQSYELVRAGLTKKVQAEIAAGRVVKPKKVVKKKSVTKRKARG